MADLCIIEKWAENLNEATVSRWLVEEGDEVLAGDALCEIITDKATFEYEAERDGIVKAIYCPPRSTVPVGFVIAFIGGPDEEPPADVRERNEALMAEHRAAAVEELDLDLDLDLGAVRGKRERRRRGEDSAVRGTPAARKLARDRDVTLEEVATALGIKGVVSEEDVRRFVGEERAHG
ncbi:MAG: hypothetical protein GX131_14360 [candidate division WS1 bacterium]|jgi:pyruvate/2-oxoglutarate dehydrogenase complex dihydrolipoamide acyltransferase (E2) component|nr:hypothetical protein [candidate division WS1 bacterium]